MGDAECHRMNRPPPPSDLAKDLSRILSAFAKVDASEGSPAALERFAGFTRRVSYAAGETMFREHEVCRDIVILTSGLVRAFYVHDDREVNLRFLCAPSVATAMASLITAEPAQETVAAVTE